MCLEACMLSHMTISMQQEAASRWLQQAGLDLVKQKACNLSIIPPL